MKNSCTPAQNILITSVSKKIPLIECIKKSKLKISDKIKIIGADSNSDCLARYMVDQFWKMPPLNDLQISEIISYCKENYIGAIIPTRDGELYFWAMHKEILKKENISVMVSDKEVIELCLDKLEFARELIKRDFLAIPTSTVLTDFDSDNIKTFVVKERYGAGSKSIGLNLLREDALHHASKLTDPIFQPFIEGEEYSVDIYVAKSGEPKGCVVRKRELVVNGESQITSTCKIPEIENLCLKIVREFSFYGHILFQVIRTSKNLIYILECNPRIGGASTLSIDYGLDSFYWFLIESIGGSLDNISFNCSSTHKRLIRHLTDSIIDLKDLSHE